ncbi:Cys-tRNA(Pro) deacylase [Aeromicrobium sp. 50.2.37]|uniref:Cys-tRNA(Pro) deacylase n=1 Tax=Aeromicrobium sp. 50.2.37 TaxID=2969305 RepID=UPI00214FBE17|nr:Cys-tRNA(Pro) deacylase [Aeromicrobium sp. 50.2.37]MCR4512274.1 Cys-tRNA(Pro) deacylase [Aeromicrobium sp. 50.2.37]
MARSTRPEATPALAAVRRAGVEHRVHRYEHDPRATSYGLEAADALGVEPARIFKTLLADVDGELAVGVVPVTAQLDLKALAATLGNKRAQMADPQRAEKATGYVLGGISPLGQRRRLRTAIDASVLDWDTVHVSAGRRGLEVELAPADLVRLTAATLGPLAR